MILDRNLGTIQVRAFTPISLLFDPIIKENHKKLIAEKVYIFDQ